MQNFFAHKKISEVSLALEPCSPWENVSNRSKHKKFEQTNPPPQVLWMKQQHPCLICHHQHTVSVETFICTGPWKCHRHTCLVNHGTVYNCLQVQEVLEKRELDWLSDPKNRIKILTESTGCALLASICATLFLLPRMHWSTPQQQHKEFIPVCSVRL